MEKVSNVYRLKGPLEAPASLRSEASAKGPAACAKKPVVELVLGFADVRQAEAWIELEKFSSQGPCEIAAYPVGDAFELRLSYAAPAGATLQTLSYGTQTSWIIDHWIVGATKGQQSTAKTKTSTSAVAGKNGFSPLVNFSEKVLDLYQDQEQWNKILGQRGQTFSFESPELDRFRTAVSAVDRALEKKPRSKRLLVPPLLALPMLDAELIFSEGSFELPRFESKDLAKQGDPRSAVALEGLNYLRKLYIEKDWLKARESIAVLERGNVKDLIPLHSARWWALKGLVYRRLAEEIKNPSLQREGIEVWREGLRRVAGRGSSDQAGADYMMLESLRDLFQEKRYYAAAATLVWSQRFRWSPETEERLSFLRAEAHYRLGLLEEAHDLFEEFVTARKDVPLSAGFDRRILPLSAFRIGDARLRLSRFQEAVDEYTRMFAAIPTQQKLSFEGNWFPSEISRYPQVFFHRAEAQLRLGNVAAALSDLRAFVNFASDHPNLGLVLYRIGDLLEVAGAPSSKVEGAWRECIFRTGQSLGGKLCKARQSARAISRSVRGEWPRLVADVEDVLLSNNLQVFEPAFENDLKLYVRVLLSDSFLVAGDPFQSYQQFEKTRGMEGSSDLLGWLEEYRLSALAGLLLAKVESGKSSEVMEFLDKAKRLPGLDESRPEVIWPLARAYSELGLWKQTLAYAERGLRADAENRPHAKRPYLPSTDDWRRLRSKVELKLLLAGDIDANLVEKHLKEIGEASKDAVLLRSWKDFHKIVKKPAKEAQDLAALKKIAALSHEEWKRYFEVLEETRNERQLRSELESYVGPWLSLTAGKTASDRPSPETFFMLFESRERQSDLSGASTVLSYMLAQLDSLGTLTKEQLLFRQGQLRRKQGMLQEARQSFEAAKALAADSMWGRLSVSELQSL